MPCDRKEARARYMTQFYRERVFNHLCVACGIQLPIKYPTRRCASCSARRYTWVKKRKKELIRGARCVNCGGIGATQKRKHCPKCLHRVREAREARRRAGICYRCRNRAEKGTTRCRACHESDRDKQRLATTGFTRADYDDFYSIQKGKCAICGKRQAKKSLNADHCHKTKAARGLLCNSCNLGLGSFKDNPRLLRAASDYLGG